MYIVHSSERETRTMILRSSVVRSRITSPVMLGGNRLGDSGRSRVTVDPRSDMKSVLSQILEEFFIVKSSCSFSFFILIGLSFILVVKSELGVEAFDETFHLKSKK